jgi:hypothetical protein
MDRLPDATDLSALFGIDLDGDGTEFAAPASILCNKCNGRGKFIGYSGRIVGNCFSCNGTGLARAACVEIKPGDCPKCVGTGEWSRGRACFACNGTGKLVESTATATAIDVSAIAKAFATARERGIKSPRLRLDTFVFSRAPDTGRNAGSIYCKEGETYLGKVLDGQFHPASACDEATRARVIAVASDPHRAAKAYGVRTGSCSCCRRELTEKLSIELGIGPVCREKYGW